MIKVAGMSLGMVWAEIAVAALPGRASCAIALAERATTFWHTFYPIWLGSSAILAGGYRDEIKPCGNARLVAGDGRASG